MHITLITQIMHFTQIMYIMQLSGNPRLMVSVTPYLSGLFRHLKCNSKPPTRVRAMDMRHVLLLMPFLLDGLLTGGGGIQLVKSSRLDFRSYDGGYYCSALVMVPPVSQTISCEG